MAKMVPEKQIFTHQIQLYIKLSLHPTTSIQSRPENPKWMTFVRILNKEVRLKL